jgi:hypothetical protein
MSDLLNCRGYGYGYGYGYDCARPGIAPLKE